MAVLSAVLFVSGVVFYSWGFGRILTQPQEFPWPCLVGFFLLAAAVMTLPIFRQKSPPLQ